MNQEEQRKLPDGISIYIPLPTGERQRPQGCSEIVGATNGGYKYRNQFLCCACIRGECLADTSVTWAGIYGSQDATPMDEVSLESMVSRGLSRSAML